MLTFKRVIKGGNAKVSRMVKWLLTMAGQKAAFCNACERNVAGFFTYGGRPWGCPLCGASTRERLVLFSIDSDTLQLDESVSSLLHVAPSEKSIIKRFRSIEDYHPVDLFPELYPDAPTQQMDLMN